MRPHGRTDRVCAPMRLITLSLAALLLLIQFPLWLGKGGWPRVHDLEAQVVVANKKIDELKARNAKLDSEVRDLKEGTGAIEERARYELGMVRQNELFIQILGPHGNASAPASTASAAIPLKKTAVAPATTR